MKHTIRATITRTYTMDTERILQDFPEFAEDIAAFGGDVKKTIERSDMFFELCGIYRDEDHVNGSYIWVDDVDMDIDVEEQQSARGGAA